MSAMSRTLGTALFVVLASAACDAAKVAQECVAADLIGQCPAGSSPVLGAQASQDCGGTFEGQTIGDGMAVSGQCGANGSCEFLCQFEVPCTCGVATLTKESIVCAECPEQSCGDSRCEGTEREFCESGAVGCQPCEEDCGGASCGDGDCTGDESPASCPQDCERVCVPSEKSCVGPDVGVCSADGATLTIVGCGGQLCAAGECVAPNVCGNGLCESGEDGVCLADCTRVCDPSSLSCVGNTLVVCAADGESKEETDCGAQVCHNGACRPANVCGNGLCEANEEACTADCAATCGNGRCENNEATTCPRDCVVCGDGTCGAGEIDSCPQDCGICVPSGKECLGKILRVCNANGTAYDDIDCNGLGLGCALGNCVEEDVCGNGLCEAGETDASCDRDCAEVCGNGRCGGLEVFETCAVDCDPVCGDGTCEGDENSLDCSFDCLATCGNGACDGLEDRDNCPRDCGFCGDGRCQDGAESASLSPPAGRESCVVDCVISECGDDSDCNDRVDCTRNQCINGSCIYSADDDLCSGDDRCITFQGCCGDDDGDGYAAESCGGSDCDDADPDVHPGALEVCGGGDRNCNGVHRPALAPAKKLTANASNKRGLKALVTGDHMTLTWSGTAAINEQLELLPVSWGLIADGAVRTLTAVRVNPAAPTIPVAYHPTKNAIGAMWAAPDGNARGAWIGLDGTVTGEIATYGSYTCVINGVGYGHNPWPYAGVVRDDGILFSVRSVYNESYSYSGGWVQLAPTTSLALAFGDRCGSSHSPDDLVAIGPLVTGLANNADLVTLDSTSGAEIVRRIDHPIASTPGVRCVLGDDGTLLTAACADGAVVDYFRLTQNGSIFFAAEEVLTGAHTPLGIGSSRNLETGVVTRDAGNNLHFFARAEDGEEILAPAIVAGGAVSGDVSVLHDGNDFVLVWLAMVGGFEQAFAQRVTCE